MVYQQLCTSYHNIDSFRAHLLALLPIATGGGIFLLLNKDINFLKGFFLFVGIFGALVTLGLFAYEIYGIAKCTALITAGQGLENSLRIDGQFASRPPGVLGFINEPFAAGMIYPALLAAWTFLAAVFEWGAPVAAGVAFFIFGIGLAVSLWWTAQIGKEAESVTNLARLNQRLLQAEEAGDSASLATHLHPTFTIVRASGERQERQAFLDAAAANANRGRRSAQQAIRLYDQCAVFSCRITTNRDQHGHAAIGHFWNTRLFLRQGEDWQCAAWQVMRIGGG
jgi:hypothetical protein